MNQYVITYNRIKHRDDLFADYEQIEGKNAIDALEKYFGYKFKRDIGGDTKMKKLELERLLKAEITDAQYKEVIERYNNNKLNDENIKNDIECGYLTSNECKFKVIWYLHENVEWIIDNIGKDITSEAEKIGLY